MANTNSSYQVFLQDLKAGVPSEVAKPATVRRWLLRLLKNRNVELANGPNAFVCSWDGAELHSLHPNHIFGFITSHGVPSHAAHMVVGDVGECLEDYRARRAACLAAGQPWVPEPDAEEVDEDVDLERQPLLGGDRSPDGAGPKRPRTRAILFGLGFLIIVGLCCLLWWTIRGSKNAANKTSKMLASMLSL